MNRGGQLIWLLLPVELLYLYRLEESHGTVAAALFTLAVLPPVLAEAAAAALFALAAPPPVLADAATAALSLHWVRRRP